MPFTMSRIEHEVDCILYVVAQEMTPDQLRAAAERLRGDLPNYVPSQHLYQHAAGSLDEYADGDQD
jgi:hypothetical protein